MIQSAAVVRLVQMGHVAGNSAMRIDPAPFCSRRSATASQGADCCPARMQDGRMIPWVATQLEADADLKRDFERSAEIAHELARAAARFILCESIGIFVGQIASDDTDFEAIVAGSDRN